MAYNLLEFFSMLPKTDDVSLTILKQDIAYQEEQIALFREANAFYYAGSLSGSL